jgi:hypothetical protein
MLNCFEIPLFDNINQKHCELLIVPDGFEVKNGFSGMARDICMSLLHSTKNIDKIRQVFIRFFFII